MAIKCSPGVSTSLNPPLGNSPPKVLEPSPAEQESLLARKGLFDRLPPSIQKRATTTARPRSSTRLANERRRQRRTKAVWYASSSRNEATLPSIAGDERFFLA